MTQANAFEYDQVFFANSDEELQFLLDQYIEIEQPRGTTASQAFSSDVFIELDKEKLLNLMQIIHFEISGGFDFTAFDAINDPSLLSFGPNTLFTVRPGTMAVLDSPRGKETRKFRLVPIRKSA